VTGSAQFLKTIPFRGQGNIDDFMVTIAGATTLFRGNLSGPYAGTAVNFGTNNGYRAMGLVNGDLIPDLIVGNSSTGAVSVMYGSCQ
jgi:hypothetical protein